jgi:hypothetical protein
MCSSCRAQMWNVSQLRSHGAASWVRAKLAQVVTSHDLIMCHCTLISNEIHWFESSSENFIELYSNPKSWTDFKLLFKIHLELVKVPITKVAPNVLIYLQKKNQIFLTFLAIFLAYWKRNKKIWKVISFLPRSTCQPGLVTAVWATRPLLTHLSVIALSTLAHLSVFFSPVRRCHAYARPHTRCRESWAATSRQTPPPLVLSCWPHVRVLYLGCHESPVTT